MGGSISIRTVHATLVATLLLAAAPGARADDLPAVVPTDAAAIAQQAVDATTAPPVSSSEAVPTPATAAPAPEAEAAPEPAAAPEPTIPAPAPKPAAPPPPPANLNVNVRVGSGGDDGPVAQTSQDGGNVNVSVRVDSPGTTGAVEQSSSAPASSPAAKAAAPDVVFHWTWTSACGVSTPRSVELDWKWSCDQAQAATVVPTAVPALPGLPALPVLPVAGDPVPMALPVVLREQVPVPFVVPVATGHGQAGAPPAVLSAAVAHAAAGGPWLPAFAPPITFRATRTVPAPTGAPAAAPSRHHAGTGARRPGPAPISPDIPLPPVALVVASAGGGSGISFVLLLALALLGAVALSGPAGPAMRLASAIQRQRGLGGRRLERPG